MNQYCLGHEIYPSTSHFSTVTDKITKVILLHKIEESFVVNPLLSDIIGSYLDRAFVCVHGTSLPFLYFVCTLSPKIRVKLLAIKWVSFSRRLELSNLK